MPCRQHLPNGQISNVVGGKCIGADGNAVVLTSCDGASMWETQSNGEAFHSLICKSLMSILIVYEQRPVEIGPRRRTVFESERPRSWS